VSSANFRTEQLINLKIGYPCINLSLDCRASRTFRLKSYSEARLKDTTQNNLTCLQRILQFNVKHRLLFLRVSSDLVPFASHPANTFDWQSHFQRQLEQIGAFITKNHIRISMHPDQFTLINSLSQEIFEHSKAELLYHAQVLDLMGLDPSAKIQIHVGGAYGNKQNSMQLFVRRYQTLNAAIRRRLVIENDHKIYTAADCLVVSSQVHIPVLFDTLHAECNPDGTLEQATKTWNLHTDGIPMVDYSQQQPQAAKGQHAQTLNPTLFTDFLKQTQQLDFDVMLEIKDKEKSAIAAMRLAQDDQRLQRSLESEKVKFS
jgi:UV DNA damage endonuclease